MKNLKKIFLLSYLSIIIIYFILKLVYSAISPYPFGDLLINYHYGFIRRGLIGTIFISISNLFKCNLYNLLTFFIAIMYILVFTYIARKTWNSKFLLLIIFTSPFGICFILNDWSSFGYKDIILLMNFIIAIQIQKIKKISLQNILLIVNVTFGALVHENYIFLSIPFILLSNDISNYKMLPNSIKENNLGEWVKKYILLLFISILLCLLILISTYYITHNDIISLKNEFIFIFSSIGKTQFNSKVAIWPLDWLMKDMKYGFEMTKINYTNNLILRISFLHILFLTFYILLIINVSIGLNKIKFYYTHFRFSIFSILLGYFFIFLIATDWGRWMFLFFMHSVLILISYKKTGLNFTKINNLIFKKYIFIFILLTSFFVFVPHVYDLNNNHKRSTFLQNIFKFSVQFINPTP